MLKKNERSHWHKLSKNEILLFYDGDPLKILLSVDKINSFEVDTFKNGEEAMSGFEKKNYDLFCAAVDVENHIHPLEIP